MESKSENARLYISQELGRLEFQRRVFEEAQDPRNPLLERLKFIAILGSNLDEFFMVRVGSHTALNPARLPEFFPEETNPVELLASVRKTALALLEDVLTYLRETLMTELDRAGIHILDYSDLSPEQKEQADVYFREIIFPVLTPLAVDPGHPFPHISNLSLNLAVLVSAQDGLSHFARVKVPQSLPYMIQVRPPLDQGPVDERSPQQFYLVWISQVIIANLPFLFPGMEVLEAHPFHVTRNAEMEIQEIEALNLLETMEENVKKRRFGAVVRLMVRKEISERVLEVLVDNLNVGSDRVYALRGPLVLRDLMQLYKLDRPDLKYRPFTPVLPPQFGESPTGEDIFSAIREGDILMHHPFDSFDPVIEFLQAAARDPNVLAIKQTLYRVGSNSPVLKTLLEACRDYGKQVAVLVELKARFDEESNISWAKLLEQEGVHVTYGLRGLKTHSKIALVVRKEGDGIRRYMHLATGNYNHVTANLYEDLGLFTCDPDIGADATNLFNYLTGYSLNQEYRKLLVAPHNMRDRLEALILREIDRQASGQEGHIIFKANNLVDKPIIELLYQASQAGVRVDLIIRSACCLVPGIPGVSENIRVISVLGRFLEHSRIFYFRNGGNEDIYLGSADLMPRNLNQRVEVLFPIQNPQMIRAIRDDILEIYLEDKATARLMLPDGSYQRLKPGPGEMEKRAQEWFMSRARLVY